MPTEKIHFLFKRRRKRLIGIDLSIMIVCKHKDQRPNNINSICAQHHASLVLAHRKGTEHLYKELTTLNSSIDIGGFWTIPNLTWDPNANRECDTNKVDVCQPAVWGHHRSGIKLSCFEDRIELMKWSVTTLNASNSLAHIIPNDATDYEALLPFPNLFNVTIISVEQSLSLCPESKTIACHRRMSEQGRCSFYLCHTISSGEMVEITFKYEPTQVIVKMLFSCHPEVSIDRGDRICHIITPQTSFLLCKTD